VTIENTVCPRGPETFLKLSGDKLSGIRLITTDVSPARKVLVFETFASTARFQYDGNCSKT
jgi:hypothetical protein